jgi:hypothetical protein
LHDSSLEHERSGDVIALFDLKNNRAEASTAAEFALGIRE